MNDTLSAPTPAVTTTFHIARLLTCLTDRLCPIPGAPPRCAHIDGYKQFLSWMIGERVATAQIGAVSQKMKPVIERQFPQFAAGQFQFEYGELVLLLESVTDDQKFNLMVGWVSKMANKYGESFTLERCHHGEYAHVDHVTEAARMMAGRKRDLLVM